MPNLGDNFTLEGKRIAIVDDVPENLKLLKSLLEKKLAQVFLFPSGEMALRAFTKNIPDLILLDINMPGLNGYEVCQRLKSVGGILADVPVIFVSAQDDIEAKTTAFIKGGGRLHLQTLQGRGSRSASCHPLGACPETQTNAHATGRDPDGSGESAI